MDSDYDDEYELVPDFRERIAMCLYRAIPHAVGVVVLCIVLWLGCRLAARVEDRSASRQWECAIETAARELNAQNAGK